MGERERAIEALTPFAEGTHGGVRRREAHALLDAVIDGLATVSTGTQHLGPLGDRRRVVLFGVPLGMERRALTAEVARWLLCSERCETERCGAAIDCGDADFQIVR
ncbi:MULTISPECIES: hypothetical protein [Sandaracinus]|uniref:hypothetical protein n=1 Tax=Sandaracinus TaxID=1055688 RepID=UPI0019D4A8DA|nr:MULTISPECIES: hypothetical protein [Sandaracinus]